MAKPIKRSYTKSSPYWQKRHLLSATPAPTTPVAQSDHMQGLASFDDQPQFMAKAGCSSGGTTAYRDQITPSWNTDAYPNISAGLVPFDLLDGGFYGASGAIGLVYSAYFNFALLRNAINLLCDFSVAPIHINTTNVRLKSFLTNWFDAIDIQNLMAQFFLEYYRSGNVFMYKFSGRVSDDSLKTLTQTFSKYGDTCTAAKGVTVPVRYIILNPMQIYLQQGPLSGTPYGDYYGWVRMLSTYEIQRLRTPQTPEDVAVLKSFPKEVQEMIKRGGTYRYLFVPLDPARLYYVFYRKQDYEPLAVPMAFSVLNDIEYKMELRRMDEALASTIERVILLVTTGRAADQYNRVPPPDNLANLQNIFRNQTIGRVLVADYTTKAEWKVPDIKELLGKAKYEQVDKDIREGLQYMFFGEEKFANASIKVKIFLETLKEGRRAFMDTFLIPEIKKVCETMGFRNVPELEFEQIALQDEALMARLYVQMGQLGLLTASEVNHALETGMLPTPEESLIHQEEYKAARTKGMYQPLAPQQNDPNGRPAGTGGTPATRKVATPIGQSKAAEETPPFHFGMVKIAENLNSMGSLRAAVEEALAKKWKIKDGLNDTQLIVAKGIAQSIIFNEEEAKWHKAIASYIKAPKDLPETVAKQLTEIQATFDKPESPVDHWMAGVLLRSKVSLP